MAKKKKDIDEMVAEQVSEPEVQQSKPERRKIVEKQTVGGREYDVVVYPD